MLQEVDKVIINNQITTSLRVEGSKAKANPYNTKMAVNKITLIITSRIIDKHKARILRLREVLRIALQASK